MDNIIRKLQISNTAEDINLIFKNTLFVLIFAPILALVGVLFVKMYISFSELLFIYFWDSVSAGLSQNELSNQFFIGYVPLLIFMPIGGLLVGIATKYVMPEGKHAGVPAILGGIHSKDGVMNWKEGVGVGIIASLSIGTGASVGRFGPGAHIGIALGSKIAQIFNLNREGKLVMAGAGMASIVAAMFGIPIAATIFMHEVFFRSYSIRTIAPIAIAGAIGHYIGVQFFPKSLYEGYIFLSLSYVDYIAVIVAALLAVFVTYIYRQALVNAPKLYGKISLPNWSKPVIGGVLLALIAMIFPQTLGLSVPLTASLMGGEFILQNGFIILLALLVAKLLAIFVSFGFGFNGGVFAPALSLGNIMGGFVAGAYMSFFGGADITSVLVAISAAAVIANFFGAPISMVIMTIEMSKSYDIALPVVICVMVSIIINNKFMKMRSHFDAPMKNLGIPLFSAREDASLKKIKVHEILDEVESVKIGESSEQLKEINSKKYVLDFNDRVLGYVSENYPLNKSDTVKETMVNKNIYFVDKNTDLHHFLSNLDKIGNNEIIVIDEQNNSKFIGAISLIKVLKIYKEINNRISEKDSV